MKAINQNSCGPEKQNNELKDVKMKETAESCGKSMWVHHYRQHLVLLTLTLKLAVNYGHFKVNHSVVR